MSAFLHLRFVLVGTQHPGNVGAAARAMKTMGLSRLVLVAPECRLDEHAYRRSAGAEDVLETAPVHTALADAVADCTFVLGCTARARRVALEELRPTVAASRILAKIDKGGEVALLFGRERTGLTNEELQLCHAAVHIPADPAFSSLNLAAAVQILAYEMRLAFLDAISAPIHSLSAFREAPASHAHLEGLFGQFNQTLDEIDFHKGRAPESAMRKLRRLFAKAELTEKEVRLLRGVLSDVQRIAMLGRKFET
ncbi:RNA methyltransferase [Xylella taiwanensis]|uniref:tRNA (cytidine/uridine-2'-O-)-methyltransferase TrmJ n=1 Tax=Xylella taiwanensis TaxID=1444770 RepID=Z9JHL7_9GAMM|nr:RNA methyltransferase [Xylella taiwanensis]AXI83180.1 RNA methyltransferase [Xylella taiwanensis]EWS77895.1 RNA methyltransferase [Xylella taiwanensis]MCD8456229.1 RNA methyltransferase [Xylella taiwanensis]MCD8458637.1 RNA methyltransferase [Xylella taiwanensis]MCD8460772.1 RNA methyltransferase [Xylella taiwanensis]